VKLLVFGATGGTGRCLVQQALAQGHTVTAFAREPAKFHLVGDNLRVVRGDILQADSVEAAVAGHDAVLSALGTRLPVRIVVLIVVVCQIIANSNLDWVIVPPAALTNGPQRNVYRAGANVGNWFVPSKISREDVAAFMLKHLADDEYVRQRPGLAY